MKELSVIIPIYNVELYLEECLNSMLHQNIEGLEVILVNDGSTDHSQEIICKYVEKYPNIFIGYEKSNGGLSDARNYGIQKATKKYITFLDGDDYIVEDGYTCILELMQRDKIDVGMYEFVWEYPDKTRESRPALPREFQELTLDTYILSHPAACNKIYKSELWKNFELEFPKGIWYEDLATIPAIVNYTDRIAYYTEEIYIYRQRENAITAQQSYDDRFMDIIKSCDRIYSLLHGRGYEAALEYLMIFQLCYFASPRYLKFGKYQELGQCISSLEDKCPNWKQNRYYQNKPKMFRIYCELIVKKHYSIANLLLKIRNAKKSL